MAETPRSVSNAILGERIQRNTETLTKMDCKLQAITTQLSEFLTMYGSEHQKVAGSATAAHQRIDELKARIDKLDETTRDIGKAVDKLLQSNKILIWVASGIGMLILAFLFRIFTGELGVMP